MPPEPTTAIIGSGIAGLTAAYPMRRASRVTLSEADSRLGGHSFTVRSTTRGKRRRARARSPSPRAWGSASAATHAVRISADVARAMYELAGASAIYEESPLQRRFRDAHTAIAHFQVNARSFELPGRLLLGLPSVTTQL